MSHLATLIRRLAGLSVSNRPVWKSITVWFAFVVSVLVLTPAAWGQDNATLTGTVSDPSGSVVANAGISLTNTATGQVRQASTNTSGVYLFANVGVGRYTLGATASGFQKHSKTESL